MSRASGLSWRSAPRNSERFAPRAVSFLPGVVHLEHTLGVERWENPQWLTMARLRFGHLRSLALSPAGSAALIERVAEQASSE